MRYISAYSIIIVGIISFSYFIPYFFSIISIEKKPSSVVYYSPVIEDFTIIKQIDKNNKIYIDRVGNEYSLNEFKMINPMMYHRDLHMKNDFPEIIGNKFISIDDVQKQFEVVYIKPDEIVKSLSSIRLYPMYESMGDAANLEFPKDLFKIEDKVEFINGENKKINKEKSEIFTKKMLDAGFLFPAKIIGGNVDPKKRLDYGYFVSDSKNDIYRIYQEKGEAKVKKTGFTSKLGNPLYIYVRENHYAKHFAIIVTDNGAVYFILKDNYEVKQMSLGFFNPYENTLRIFIDPLNYTTKLISSNKELTFAFDNNLNLISNYEKIIENNMNTILATIFDIIFPFVIYDDKNNIDAPLKFEFSTKILYSLSFSLVLSISYLIFVGRKYKIDKYGYIDAVIIFATSIFGLLSILILNKERRNYFGFRVFS